LIPPQSKWPSAACPCYPRERVRPNRRRRRRGKKKINKIKEEIAKGIINARANGLKLEKVKLNYCQKKSFLQRPCEVSSGVKYI
jgi:hypothetical protein